MDIPKYARVEIERRALVDPALCPRLKDEPFDLIEDLYVARTRLRLRKMTDAGAAHATYKFCKKYPTPNSMSGLIVNTYLDAAEYAVLRSLPGHEIRKRRYRILIAGVHFGIDVFQGDLDGLILCEFEAPTLEAARAVGFPRWAPVEVTDDPFFTGGNLCRIKPEQLLTRLSGIAARLTD